MHNRLPFALIVVIAVLGIAQSSALGQTARPAKESAPRAVPRMPDGHPDLQGTYDLATLTPVERPA